MSFAFIRTLFCCIAAAAALVTLNSCSSSPGDPALIADTGSGSGASTNTGGIGGSGCTDLGCVDLAVGDITGFGSVIINGAVYDTSGAQFSINGMPASESDFKIGMNVTAAVNLSTEQFAAGSITYAPIVLGPVTTTALAASTFDVLGQTVIIDSNTVLDNVSLVANASNVIAEGAVVEVSGIRNADNAIVASYIRRADSATSYQLQGSIEAEVNAAQQLLIDGLLVDVSGVDPEQLASNANEGDVVSLFLTPNVDTFTAVVNSTIAAIPTINELLTRFNGSQIRVEGFISNNTFGSIFTFGDLQVFASGDTVYRFANGMPANAFDLGANSRIELVATTTGVGIVTADEVIIIER